jgi:hypothetical protein
MADSMLIAINIDRDESTEPRRLRCGPIGGNGRAGGGSGSGTRLWIG